jgi:hypothetical protein
MVGNQTYPLRANSLFDIGCGIWAVALHWRVRFMCFRRIDSDEADYFLLAIHVYQYGVTVDKCVNGI